ncbi:MAG: glycosyltransferase family 4 protein [Bradymonadia bacterium]
MKKLYDSTAGRLFSLSRRKGAPQALLVTAWFPPAVGGSCVLYENIYGWMAQERDVPVQVLTDEVLSPGADGPFAGMQVQRRPIQTLEWGVTDFKGSMHHLSVVKRMRQLSRGQKTVIHTGRGLPEGLWAWANRYLGGGAPYVCWAHGEEMSFCADSRELAMLMRPAYGGAAFCIANSKNSGSLLEGIGVPSKRIKVVYPGVNLDYFNPEDHDGSAIRARYAPNPDDILMLTVGRLQRRKGHDMAIKAVARLKDSHPNLKYVILSDGEERENLQQLIDTHDLGDRVFLVGQIEWADMPKYYAACDLFVMPNRDDGSDLEGFGIVFIEAQSMGVPVIGGRSGGVPEAVGEGEVGFLADGTDAEDIAHHIARLADDEALRRRFGDAGKIRARRFTWQSAAQQVLDIHEAAAET